MIKKIIILLILMTASNFYGVGISDFQILKIPADTVGSGMGSAVIAEASGISGFYWNPSLLNKMFHSELMLNYNKWITDISCFNAGYGIKLNGGKQGALGLIINYIDFADIDGIDLNGSTFSYGVYYWGMEFGYSLDTKFFTAGCKIKYFQQSIYDSKETSFGLDFGAYKNIRKFTLGFVLKNIGIVGAADSILNNMPIVIQAGIGYSIHKKDTSVKMELDVEKPIDEIFNINTGIEYGYKNLYGRIGYKFEAREDSLDFSKGISFGAGIRMKKFDFNIARIFLGELGSSFQASMTIKI